MAEEQFFEMFVNSLRESVSRVTPIELQYSAFRNTYLSKWNLCEDSVKPDGALVACDGSIGESSFSGGLVVWVARAIAHIYSSEGSPTSIFRVATEADYKLQNPSLFMKTLELRTLREALRKAVEKHGGAFGVFDGSLYLTFLHYRDRLRAFSRFFEKYVRELSLLLNMVDDNTLLVGVSKDSDISYLRAKIMLSIISDLDTSFKNSITRGRSIRRIRELLKNSVKDFPEDSPLRSCLKELEHDFSDEGVYSELAPGSGFTTPLLLAPQTLFLTGEGRTESWRESNFRKLLEEDDSLKGVLDALDEYFSKPPIALTYWRPRTGIGVYRLDVPSRLLGYKDSCSSLPHDVFMENVVEKLRSIIGVLNYMQRGPHVVYPLVEVDTIVRLDRGLYKNAYEPVIVEELKKRGFKTSPRRRSVRDMVLRGY